MSGRPKTDFGNSIPDLDLGELNSPAANAPASSNSDLFKASQNASLRYTKIPFTVLFADGRFDQESVNQFQEQDPDDPRTGDREPDPMPRTIATMSRPASTHRPGAGAR